MNDNKPPKKVIITTFIFKTISILGVFSLMVWMSGFIFESPITWIIGVIFAGLFVYAGFHLACTWILYLILCALSSQIPGRLGRKIRSFWKGF
jgi:hypothetical protein